MFSLIPINGSHLFLAKEINIEFNPNEEINSYKFMEYIVNIPKGTEIYVLKYNQCVLGCATLIIENKMIHNFSNVAHIEDVFIRPQFRNKKFGLELIRRLTDIAKNKNCYKVILDCKKELREFYIKCGFESKNIQMSKYF